MLSFFINRCSKAWGQNCLSCLVICHPDSLRCGGKLSNNKARLSVVEEQLMVENTSPVLKGLLDMTQANTPPHLEPLSEQNPPSSELPWHQRDLQKPISVTLGFGQCVHACECYTLHLQF